MSNITIRSYSADYKNEVQRLILDIQVDEFHIPITIKDQPDLENISGFYQQGYGNFWMALVNEEVIGTIALLDIGNGDSALRKMFVKKEFRGKPFLVGQSLLDNLLQWASRQGVQKIYLGTTAQFLSAQRFYEKNNFEAIDKSLLPTRFPIMKVDVKFYVYTV